jgi:molecular chaperone GrpE
MDQDERTPDGPEDERRDEAASAAANDDVSAPPDSVEALKAEAAELKDRLLRALAETENVRRRGVKDREDAAKYAVSAFARDMVKVAEDLRRALASVEADGAASGPLVEGVRLTERELLAALERHGVKRVDPQPGERFNHELHEAMFEVPTDAQEPGTVAHVMEAGYTIHDRLLRPARVGVAKAASPRGEAHVDTTA